jgi:hypothetical protein
MLFGEGNIRPVSLYALAGTYQIHRQSQAIHAGIVRLPLALTRRLIGAFTGSRGFLGQGDE